MSKRTLLLMNDCCPECDSGNALEKGRCLACGFDIRDERIAGLEAAADVSIELLARQERRLVLLEAELKARSAQATDWVEIKRQQNGGGGKNG